MAELRAVADAASTSRVLGRVTDRRMPLAATIRALVRFGAHRLQVVASL